MKKFALLVGIDEYADATIRSLTCAQHDAQNMAFAFSSLCGFETMELRGREATSVSVVDAFEKYRTAAPEDIFLFFFAGHGFEHREDGHLLLMQDARRSSLKSMPTGVLAVRRLKNLLSDIPCRRHVLILDACRTELDATRAASPARLGQIAARDIAALGKMEDGYDCRVICSCKPQEEAVEIPTKRAGVFTQAFKDVLEQRNAQGREIAIDGGLMTDVNQTVRRLLDLNGYKDRAQHPWMEGSVEPLVLLPGNQSKQYEIDAEQRQQEREAAAHKAEQRRIEEEERLRKIQGEQENAKRAADEAERKRQTEENRLQAIQEFMQEQERQQKQDEGKKPSSSNPMHILSILAIILLAIGGYVIYRQNTRLIEVQRKSEASVGKSSPVDAQASQDIQAGQSRSFDIGSGIKVEMVWCPPGEFMMGSPAIEKYHEKDESPLHRVTLTHGFWLGKYEVTQAQWKKIMGTNPSTSGGDLNLPVESVSWEDCQEFIKKINTQGDGSFRLPSEAEWEYACRAGVRTRYFFGDSDSQLRDYAWFCDNSGSETHPVGKKKPNAWGLYDMHGNVWEWCQDWYHTNYNEAPTDGSAWESPEDEDRVLRGGSWNYQPGCCRAASRSNLSPDYRLVNLGFRLLRTP